MSDPQITGLPIFTPPPDATTAGTAPPRRSIREALAALPLATPRSEPDVDWALVRAFRQQAATRLSDQVDDTTTEAGRRAAGREIIAQLLDDHIRQTVTTGGVTLGVDHQAVLAQAVFDALFGLGRLQPLVDDPAVENIEVYGAEPVVVIDGDGRITRRPPVVESADELVDLLTFLASRGGSSERTFSTASPSLHLHLHGGHRLAASGWTTHQPVVVIRRHRLVDIDLHDLVERGTLTPQAAAFLRAAVRSRRSIVVSGSMGAGKTTLTRALANEIDPEEKLGTIETEYELGLHHLRERHRRIIAWEARPGSGERGPDGRAVGEITLDDLVYDALRMNLDRLIVGEVRGREVLPMFKAMQSGAGSLSTIHAHSARASIERLVTCAMEAGHRVSAEFAYRQIAQHVDLVVHVETRTTPSDARRRRVVTEIIALEPGEHGLPAITDVFRLGPGGELRPDSTPSWLAGLPPTGSEWAAGLSESRWSGTGPLAATPPPESPPHHTPLPASGRGAHPPAVAASHDIPPPQALPHDAPPAAASPPDTPPAAAPPPDGKARLDAGAPRPQPRMALPRLTRRTGGRS
ncbi:CpaF family protein [Jiangella alba]|uniref:Pilus assembly protein, ATPase of CpaF family n=1 Tax=Jiangella alba TaxID=561176 RepID=A0A1H5PIX0_9ACTN|nr:CpaF/VirB11 family protein [Jiangella alba]SEF13843.1 Pilus assembly protein, ATPase of CpaF family [Jiangella alba]